MLSFQTLWPHSRSCLSGLSAMMYSSLLAKTLWGLLSGVAAGEPKLLGYVFHRRRSAEVIDPQAAAGAPPPLAPGKSCARLDREPRPDSGGQDAIAIFLALCFKELPA